MKAVPQPRPLAMPLDRVRRAPVALPDRWLPILLIGPALLALALVLLYPLVYSFWLSLHAYNLVDPIRFVGLRNYARALTDDRVWSSLRVTFAFAVPVFCLELLIGFALALAISYKAAAKGVWRTLFALPLMLTPVVVGINWRVLLNYDFGMINGYLVQLGLPRQNWVNDGAWALPALIAVDVWHTTSFVTLVLAAGLAALPEEMYAAAAVDGASFWQQVRSLTIPLLKPLFLVIALFRSYELLRVFDVVYSLTRGGPARATETISVHIFDRTFAGWQVGYSAALSYILFFISVAISVVLIRLIGTSGSSEGEEGR